MKATRRLSRFCQDNLKRNRIERRRRRAAARALAEATFAGCACAVSAWAGLANGRNYHEILHGSCVWVDEDYPAGLAGAGHLGVAVSRKAAKLVRFILEQVPCYRELPIRKAWDRFRRDVMESRGGEFWRLRCLMEYDGGEGPVLA